MKKFLAGAVSAALGLVGLGIATAAPAAATEPAISASCSSLDVYLWDTSPGTVVTVSVDGEVVAVDSQMDSYYSNSFGLTWSQAHEWTVDVDVPDGDSADVSQSGTTQPCDSDPNVWATSWDSCKDVTLNVAEYPDGTHATVVVDGATVVDEVFDQSYYTTQSFDWAVSHTWSITVDAPDDALDRAMRGVTSPCESNPDIVLEAQAWCGSVDGWGWGYPAGSQVAITVDGAMISSTTVDEGGYFSLSAQPDPAVDYTWQVTVQDDAGQLLGERSDSVSGCAPWVPPVVQASTTCSSVITWVDGAAVEDGSTIEVQVDGQVVASEAVGSYYYRIFDVSWDAAHAWTARVIAPDGSETGSDAGMTEPCSEDPDPPLSVSSSCGDVWAAAQDPVFTAGSRFELVVDGEVVSSQEFAVHADASVTVDHLLPHTYSATATTPDGTTFEATGSTEPCSQGEHAVHVTTGCEAIAVHLYDPYLGDGARARLEIDGVTVLDESVPTYYDTAVPVDQSVDHTWTFTLDAQDDRRDWTESGTTMNCSWGPTLVTPERPDALTTCDATPGDVVVPPSTEAVTYTLTPDGLLATANPGYAFSWLLKDSQYWQMSDTEAVVSLRTLLAPRCGLTGTVTATPVCESGEAFLDYAVEPPEGAVEEGFTIGFEGPGHARESLTGDGGFGHPFSGRLPWPNLVRNDDGTISNTADPEIRATSVHVHFYVAVPMMSEWGSYSRLYDAASPDLETIAPCGPTTDAGDDDGSPAGHAFGRGHVGHPLAAGHPVFPQFPGQGVTRQHA